MTSTPTPLAGLRVIDWTHVLAGPFAGYQLGLLGAEVIRIERADGDDMIRAKGLDAELTALGLGETFVTQGAGKRSLAIDARDPRAKQALAELIGSADVLLENFRPGKLAALGFDPQQLIARHPQLVVCSITGFGPASDRRAYDHVIQAASGLMAANADRDGKPQRVGFPLVDYAVGQQAALAVMSALYRRDRPNGEARVRGEWLQVSMMGAALTLMAPTYAGPLVSGMEMPRSASTAFSGSPLSGTFEVADGQLAIVCNAADQARGLLNALRETGTDASLLSSLHEAAEQRDVPRTQALLGQALSGRTTAEWDALLTRHGVPATPVMRPAQAAAQMARDWPHVELPLPNGARRVPVPGIGFTSSEPLTPSLRAPVRRGADTRRLLAEAGLEAPTIAAMLADGAASEPSD
ncbi:crotonobetainyl-CoA:carnitine CoA-transferase CaiB-like acyl-CoA transferase [Variovorax boronicumulans]|uniref:CaiB/BaiF CoA transferase family protein n=1 Tax=Variovorax boronicumulans TaxID=436515 RepID=UPI003396C1DB